MSQSTSTRNERKPTWISNCVGHVTQASWLYPLKGVVYFLTHPFLYPLIKGRLIPAVLLSVFVTVTLFVWTYIPQVLALLIYQGRSAWLNATVLVLGESLAATALLFEIFFVDETQVDVFDAVLINEGHDDLVSQGREILPDVLERGGEGHVYNPGNDGHITRTGKGNPVERLGQPVRPAEYAPFSFRQIVEFVLFLPLNFIPYAGTPLFLVATGYRAGPFHHWRYFRLRGFDKKERKKFVKRRKLQYTWFGTVSLILQLVPILNMVFLCTSAVGSAQWAAKIEDRRKAIIGEGQGRSRAADEPFSDYPV